MTIQLSTAVRNARMDALETTIGAAPVLKIRTGAQPANCAAGDTGVVLATYTLASDWMTTASGGQKTVNGLPLVASASATGTAGHYRVYDALGTTCHMQGSVGTAGADMLVDNTSITNGAPVNVVTWSMSDGNA